MDIEKTHESVIAFLLPPLPNLQGIEMRKYAFSGDAHLVNSMVRTIPREVPVCPMSRHALHPTSRRIPAW